MKRKGSEHGKKVCFADLLQLSRSIFIFSKSMTRGIFAFKYEDKKIGEGAEIRKGNNGQKYIPIGPHLGFRTHRGFV